MIDLTTFTVLMEDNRHKTITIDPVIIGLPEVRQFTGVYRILETDMTGKELAEIAFHLEDSSQWEFTGDYFSNAEQEQIVTFIRQKEPFDSFTFAGQIDNVEHHFRITDNEGHFGVERDGIFIAVIEQFEEWRQTEGEPLGEDLFDKIISKIEGRRD
ncbi:hypothetical protein [Mucilaginibacter rubeus]|uniref:Uncharacterized protein n=1 Tax=Mucilaginibacter rubeus TaxID=2027860 RepID=A0A5C1I2C1_9SPHI|nr:hypothetical protein [Mucilaginibacter rubeus]QEM12382.1 hypothetical protein DEO27_020960 [Mucilaginibacter rubeus]